MLISSKNIEFRVVCSKTLRLLRFRWECQHYLANRKHVFYACTYVDTFSWSRPLWLYYLWRSSSLASELVWQQFRKILQNKIQIFKTDFAKSRLQNFAKLLAIYWQFKWQWILLNLNIFHSLFLVLQIVHRIKYIITKLTCQKNNRSDFNYVLSTFLGKSFL